MGLRGARHRRHRRSRRASGVVQGPVGRLQGARPRAGGRRPAPHLHAQGGQAGARQPGGRVVTDSPVRLGSILFTLVEPHRGFEVAYNRWYERDHFYAGVLVGPHTLAGQRWVATRADKELRQPVGMPGSYLGLYWIEAGHHDEWNRWGVDTVKRLHAEGRMYAARDHVHTALYALAWAARRDPDGVPPELALDHRYRGLVAMLVEASGPVDDWYRDEHVPAALRH